MSKHSTKSLKAVQQQVQPLLKRSWLIINFDKNSKPIALKKRSSNLDQVQFKFEMKLLRQNMIKPNLLQGSNHLANKKFSYLEPQKLTSEFIQDRKRLMQQLYIQKLTERFKQQQAIRVKYNLNVLQEIKILQLKQQADASFIQIPVQTESSDSETQKGRLRRQRKTLVQKQIGSINKSDHKNEILKLLESLKNKRKQQQIKKQSSSGNLSSRSDFESNNSHSVKSFNSDESYYDENDEYFLFQPNHKNLLNQKDDLFQIQKNQNFSTKFQLNHQALLDQSESLHEIFEISDKINSGKIQEQDFVQITKFISCLPVFNGEFLIVSKITQRYLLENMRVKIFNRGQVLFKQGDLQNHTYFIFLGVINFYDELKKDYDGLNKDNISIDSFQQNEVKIINQVQNNAFHKINIEQQDNIVNEQEKLSDSDLSFSSILSLSEFDLLNKKVDSSINIIKNIQYKKVGCAQAGQAIGKIQRSYNLRTYQKYTGICKTDCIILELEQNIFSTLEKQKKKQEKEYVVNHLKLTFPKLTEFYAIHKIIENLSNLDSRRTYCKNEMVQVEAQKQKCIYLILQGKVMILKKIHYEDERDSKTLISNEKIMEVQIGDIIGEDMLWYNRSNQYSARVSSLTLNVLCINNNDFQEILGKIIPSYRQLLDDRNNFIATRVSSIRFQLVQKNLQLNKNISNNEFNQWLLYKAKHFDHSKLKTEKNIKKMYFRNQFLKSKSNSPRQKKSFQYNFKQGKLEQTDLAELSRQSSYNIYQSHQLLEQVKMKNDYTFKTIPNEINQTQMYVLEQKKDSQTIQYEQNNKILDIINNGGQQQKQHQIKQAYLFKKNLKNQKQNLKKQNQNNSQLYSFIPQFRLESVQQTKRSPELSVNQNNIDFETSFNKFKSPYFKSNLNTDIAPKKQIQNYQGSKTLTSSLQKINTQNQQNLLTYSQRFKKLNKQTSAFSNQLIFDKDNLSFQNLEKIELRKPTNQKQKSVENNKKFHFIQINSISYEDNKLLNNDKSFLEIDTHNYKTENSPVSKNNSYSFIKNLDIKKIVSKQSDQQSEILINIQQNPFNIRQLTFGIRNSQIALQQKSQQFENNPNYMSNFTYKVETVFDDNTILNHNIQQNNLDENDIMNYSLNQMLKNENINNDLKDLSISSNQSLKIEDHASLASSINQYSNKQLYNTQYQDQFAQNQSKIEVNNNNCILKNQELSKTTYNANHQQPNQEREHVSTHSQIDLLVSKSEDKDKIELTDIKYTEENELIKKSINGVELQQQQSQQTNVQTSIKEPSTENQNIFKSDSLFPLKVFIKSQESQKQEQKVQEVQKLNNSKSELETKYPKTNQMKHIFQYWQAQNKKLNEKIKQRQIMSFSNDIRIPQNLSTNQTSITNKQNNKSSVDDLELSFQQNLKQKGINNFKIKKKFENVIQLQAQRQSNLSQVQSQNLNQFSQLNHSIRIQKNERIQLPIIQQKILSLSQDKKKKQQNTSNIETQFDSNVNKNILKSKIQLKNILQKNLNSLQSNSQNISNPETPKKQNKEQKINQSKDQANILMQENYMDSKQKQENINNKNIKNLNKYQQLSSGSEETGNIENHMILNNQKDRINSQQNSSQLNTIQRKSKQKETIESTTQISNNIINNSSIPVLKHQLTDQFIKTYYKKQNNQQSNNQYSSFNTHQVLRQNGDKQFNKSMEASQILANQKQVAYDKYLPYKLLKPINKHLSGLQSLTKVNRISKLEDKYLMEPNIQNSIFKSQVDIQKPYQNFLNRKFDHNNYILQQKQMRFFIQNQIDSNQNLNNSFYKEQQKDHQGQFQKQEVNSQDSMIRLEENFKMLSKLSMDKIEPNIKKENKQNYISNDSIKKIQKMVNLDHIIQKNEEGNSQQFSNPYEQIVKGQQVVIDRFKPKQKFLKLNKYQIEEKIFFQKLEKNQKYLKSKESPKIEIRNENLITSQSSMHSRIIQLPEVQNN